MADDQQPASNPTTTPPPPEPVQEGQETPANSEVMSRKHSSIGLAVGLAILISAFLVFLGILAYKNSDTLPVDDTDSTSETNENTTPTETEVDQELDEINAELERLDQQELDELDEGDLSDETLELE